MSKTKEELLAALSILFSIHHIVNVMNPFCCGPDILKEQLKARKVFAEEHILDPAVIEEVYPVRFMGKCPLNKDISRNLYVRMDYAFSRFRIERTGRSIIMPA